MYMMKLSCPSFKAIFIISFSLIFNIHAFSQDWTPVFVDRDEEFTNYWEVPYSLATDNEDLFVSIAPIMSNRRLVVKKFDQTSSKWINLGGSSISDGEVIFSYLTFNKGTPYVIYGDAANEQKVTVKFLDKKTKSWITLGNPSFAEGGSALKLVFDNKDIFALVDGLLTKFNPQKNIWEDQGEKFTGAGCSVKGICYGYFNKTHYIAAQTGCNLETEVRKMDTGSGKWVRLGKWYASEGMSNQLSSTMIDSIPYIFFEDFSFAGKGTVRKYRTDGSGWENVGKRGFSSGIAFYNSITVRNNVLYAAYWEGGQNGRLTVRKFDTLNNTWIYVGRRNVSDSKIVNPAQMVFIGNMMYISYFEKSSKAIFNLKKIELK